MKICTVLLHKKNGLDRSLRNMNCRYSGKILKGRYYLGDLEIIWRILLNWILGICYQMDRTGSVTAELLHLW
jgi:hypothetical protein